VLLIFLSHVSLTLFQAFRFVERPAVRGLISYLNPQVDEGLIPKKTCMADAVMTRVERLEDLTIDLVKVRSFFGDRNIVPIVLLHRLSNQRLAWCGMVGLQETAAHTRLSA
jgi:hypothetical protein